MDDLEALFDSVDGFKEDLIDFGIAGAAAVGANMVAGYLDKNFLTKHTDAAGKDAGFDVPTWAKGAGFLVLGVAGGAFLAKYNRNAATGVAVGLAFRGINTLLRLKNATTHETYLPKALTDNLPNLDLAGLSNVEYRMLGPGLSAPSAGGPVMVEEVSGFNGATQTVEQVSGLVGTFA